MLSPRTVATTDAAGAAGTSNSHLHAPGGSDDARVRYIVNDTYVVEEFLGSGSYGEVHRGVHRHTNESVAIKIEVAGSRQARLEYEYQVYRVLHTRGGRVLPTVVGIPRTIWFGKLSDRFIAMIMEECGPTLEDLFNYCQRYFTQKTVFMIGIQMLNRLEYVHSRGIIHKDVKPDNFLLGAAEKGHVLHIIDFGLSKSFRLNRHTHIPFREGQLLMGTARYCSANAHRGYELSRRDDLESMGYILIYFTLGKLPWQGLKSTRERILRIGQMKEEISVADLCEGCPAELKVFMRYIKGLSFAEAPDYSSLRRLFEEAMHRIGASLDWEFDWISKRDGEVRIASELSGECNTPREAATPLADLKPSHNDAAGSPLLVNRNPFLRPSYSTVGQPLQTASL